MIPGAAKIGRAYFAAQALAGAAWWWLVFAGGPVRELTLGGLDHVLVACFDLPLFVAASALAAAGVRWMLETTLLWTLLVAALMAGYATVTGSAGWGALCMAAAAGGSLLAALLIRTGGLPTERLFSGPFGFRQAPPASSRRHLRRTAGQITLFWGLFLGVLPAGIVFLEQRWGLAVSIPAPVRWAGAVLLLAASALGLAAARVMSRLGEGTPLPAAMPARLVVAGPYRWVRNPMAVAGIAQGVAVGMLWGSWLVAGYALCGGLFWHLVVRPAEESDLLSRFGTPYREYREKVRCWLPRFHPIPASGPHA